MESLACAVASLMELNHEQSGTLGNIEDRLEGVEVQTKATNGQVIDLKKSREEHAARLVALERPAGEIKTVCKVIGKAGAVVVAVVGIVTGIITTVGSSGKPSPDEIKAIVEQAVKDAKSKPTP